MCFDSNDTGKEKRTEINGVKVAAVKKKQPEMKKTNSKNPDAEKALEQGKGILKSNSKGKTTQNNEKLKIQ